MMPPTPPDLAEGTMPQPPRAMSADEIAQMQASARGFRLVKRAARTAGFSAMSTLVIGVGTGVYAACSPDELNIVVAAALLLVGGVEYAGYRMLRRAEPAAALLLGRNQLLFLALIAAYCIWQMATFSPQAAKASGLSAEDRSLLAQLPEMQQELDSTIDTWGAFANRAFYCTVLLVSVAFQGGLALYYFSRRRSLENFRAQTPEWARKMFELAE